MPEIFREVRPFPRSQSPSGELREQRLLEDEALERATNTFEGLTNSFMSSEEVQLVLEELRFFHHNMPLLPRPTPNYLNRRKPIPDDHAPLLQPPPCSFLRQGQQFSGWQRVLHWAIGPEDGEQWQADVLLKSYDHATGVLTGVMTAHNVPESTTPVTTFFEAEIVDNVNFSFYTAHVDWSALACTDMRHWSKFPHFRKLRADVETYGGRAPGLADSGAVFMRWKEKMFIAGGVGRLTIAGFYYVCLERSTGTISAVYYDPSSSPDQKLQLTAVRGGVAGHAFPEYEFA